MSTGPRERDGSAEVEALRAELRARDEALTTLEGELAARDEALAAASAELVTSDKAVRFLERKLRRLEAMATRSTEIAQRHQVLMLRANEDLEREAARADGAARAKGLFAAQMSHEVRTPMNGLLGMLDLLGDTRLDDEQRVCVETATRAMRELLALLDDALDLAKVEAGSMAVRVGPTDVRGVIEDACAIAGAPGAKRQVACWPVVDLDVPRLVATDGRHLRQVLTNLIGNAVKYTDSGEVVVSASWAAEASALVLEVRDTGTGIDPRQLERIFEPFAQSECPGTRLRGGTGLGLAIVRELVALHGGAVDARSEIGLGTTIVVTWPVAAREASESAAAPVSALRVGLLGLAPSATRALASTLAHLGHTPEPLSADTPLETLTKGAVDALVVPRALLGALTRRVQDTPIVLMTDAVEEAVEVGGRGGAHARLFLPLRAERVAAALGRAVEAHRELPDRVAPTVRVLPRPGRAPTGGRVLIVDDNPVNQLVARRFCERAGYRCEVVGDGMSAVEAAQREDFDAILMDCQMPQMDGFAAARRIRGEERGRAVIIAVTASALADDRDRCLAAGMDDFLPKPLDGQALEAMLARHLQARAPGGADAVTTRADAAAQLVG
ncbi:MAG: response regulator [Myxococcales bacterium]|nr:response regulator [Myxococcales bacterium]